MLISSLTSETCLITSCCKSLIFDYIQASAASVYCSSLCSNSQTGDLEIASVFCACFHVLTHALCFFIHSMSAVSVQVGVAVLLCSVS